MCITYYIHSKDQNQYTKAILVATNTLLESNGSCKNLSRSFTLLDLRFFSNKAFDLGFAVLSCPRLQLTGVNSGAINHRLCRSEMEGLRYEVPTMYSSSDGCNFVLPLCSVSPFHSCAIISQIEYSEYSKATVIYFNT